MIIDTDEVEATCLFCPYAVDKKHWNLILSSSSEQHFLLLAKMRIGLENKKLRN